MYRCRCRIELCIRGGISKNFYKLLLYWFCNNSRARTVHKWGRLDTLRVHNFRTEKDVKMLDTLLVLFVLFFDDEDDDDG